MHVKIEAASAAPVGGISWAGLVAAGLGFLVCVVRNQAGAPAVMVLYNGKGEVHRGAIIVAAALGLVVAVN